MKLLLIGVVMVFGLCDATQIGCDNKPLISGDKHHVLDSQLSASSSYYNGGWNYGPARSRLRTQILPYLKLGGSWHAAATSQLAGQWIQVDFINKMFVAAIATKGRHDHPQWVTSYTIKYSINGHTWRTYTEGAGDKIFKGNWDHYTISKHKFKRPFVARFVRLYPVTWANSIVLRWEIYGCPLQDKHCPPGFTHSFTHGTPVYNVAKAYQSSCYRFVTAQKNWLEARSECQKLGSGLVSVETAGEQHHLETVIRKNPALQKPAMTDAYRWGYWTSGTDSGHEGSWIWAATGRSIGYKNWGKGQPNNKYQGFLNEDCLLLDRGIAYKWNDYECTNNFISYICETKALA